MATSLSQTSTLSSGIPILDRLREEQEDLCNALLHDQSDQKHTLNQLSTLSNKLSHPVMVAWNNHALFSAKVIHTNEMIQHLGSSYYAHRNLGACQKSLTRLHSQVQDHIEQLQQSLQQLQLQHNLAVDTKMPQTLVKSETSSLTDSQISVPSAVITQPTSSNPPAASDQSGFIRKTTDGFLEIVEHYSSSSEDES